MGNGISGDKELHWGLLGAVVAALCCFTPVLVILLSSIGLSWAVGYLDYVLLPTLALLVALMIYGVWKRQRNSKNCVACDCETPTKQQNIEKP